MWLGSYERDYPRTRVLIDGLTRRGVAVTEIHRPVWERTRDKTGSFLRPGALARTGLGWTRAWREMLAEARDAGPVDAVVAGYPAQPDALPARLVSRRLDAPLVVDAMISLADTLAGDRGLAGPVAGRILAGVDRVTLRAADIVMADTAANAEWMRHRLGVRADRLVVVPVGAEPERFPRRPPPSGPAAALFYGKLSPLHGLATIVAAARLPGVPPVGVIGEGQLSSWLAAELARDRPHGFAHRAWVPYEELGAEVAGAAICLGVFGRSDKASRVVPNKVYQAMAVGRPVVTADTPGAREAIRHGVDGLLVPAGDAEALAVAMIALDRDPALRARMGDAAHTRFTEVAHPGVVADRLLAALR